jgi:enediyne biosynthesis protein E4
MRRGRLIVVVGIVLVLGGWIGLWAFGEWRYRSELRQAAEDFAGRRYSEAGDRLALMALRWPGRAEVEYWLGTCKLKEGDREAALDAWGRVPDDSPEAPAVAMARAGVAIELFRYGLAEACLKRAIRGGGEKGDEARRLLGRIYWITGRRDEYRRLLQKDAERARDPSDMLRTFWSLDHDPYKVDSITEALGKAKRSAPDDDRVWLALADLATRLGHYDEAGEWLTRCEQARPDDLDVWNARLRWAKTADRPDEVLRAASHLPAADLPKSRLVALRAWLAARAGDRQTERSALEEFLQLEPTDIATIDRLADLAAQDGEKDRVAELRRRKSELEKATDDYKQLVNHPDLTSLAVELARSAEAIGRRYDAKTWWRVAAQRDPSLDHEATLARARLAKAEPPTLAGPGSLAELMGPLSSKGSRARVVAGKLSMPTYVDEAEARGLVFTFDNGRSAERQLPETMSGGVGLLDFDGDGWLDVYAIQGGKFPPPPGPAQFGDRLFRNRGDGRFVDVTVSSGLAKLPGGYGHGVAVGDYDNDSRPDLFVTRWRSYALYHNLGGGRFEDATATAGLGGDRDWPTSAAWADLDNDGDLDLYVCHYLKWDELHPKLCGTPGKPDAGYDYCDPAGIPAVPDHVFRNDGGRFVDVTAATGFVDDEGRGLGVVAGDLDGDGKVDLFVANDTTPNYFLRNRGGFRFSEEALVSGLAASAGGGYLAGMGVACADFDGDGRLDLAVTNFFDQSTTLYHNHGGGVFSDRSTEAGLAAPTRHVLGFGLAALDANNDGWPDLAQANGHVSDLRPTLPYPMPAQLFLNEGHGQLVDVSDRSGAPWKVPRLARGLAIGDIDNDGCTDVVIVSENDPLALLRNQPSSQNHFLTLLLEGAHSNHDAVGALVTVTAGGKTQVAARLGGGSYLSASDPRLHFGLGSARTADRVEVTWPSGKRDIYQGLAADAGYGLTEGRTAARPLAGFSHSAVAE